MNDDKKINDGMKIREDEPSLFGDLDQFSDWSKEWQGMPEFIQNDARPIQQIIVSFQEEKDVIEFAKLIDQRITQKTKSIWFPKLQLEKPSSYVYTDEP